MCLCNKYLAANLQLERSVLERQLPLEPLEPLELGIPAARLPRLDLHESRVVQAAKALLEPAPGDAIVVVVAIRGVLVVPNMFPCSLLSLPLGQRVLLLRDRPELPVNRGQGRQGGPNPGLQRRNLRMHRLAVLGLCSSGPLAKHQDEAHEERQRGASLAQRRLRHDPCRVSVVCVLWRAWLLGCAAPSLFVACRRPER